MSISNYSASFGSVFLTVILQILIFIIFCLVVKLVKIIFKQKLIQRFKYLDLIPLFSLFFIKSLTTNQHGYSLLPFFILFWSIFGIGLLFLITKKYKELVLRRFWVVFWRFGDLFLGFSWLIIIIYRFLIIL